MTTSTLWDIYIAVVIAGSIATALIYLGSAVAARLVKPSPRSQRVLRITGRSAFGLLAGVAVLVPVTAVVYQPALLSAVSDKVDPFHKPVTIQLEPTDYETWLRRRQATIRASLVDAEGIMSELRANEQEAISAKLENVDASYQTYVNDLRRWVRHLESFDGSAPEDVVENARLALATGADNEALVDRYLDTLENAPGVSRLLAARTAGVRGALARHWARYDAALHHFSRAAELAPDNVHYGHWAAYLAGKSGRNAEAAEHFGRVYEDRLRRYGESHPKTVEIAKSLTWYYLELAQYRKAISTGENALKHTLESVPLDYERVSYLSDWLSYACGRIGEDAKAVNYAKMALKAYTDLHEPRAVKVAEAEDKLGRAFERAGEYRNALEHYRRSLDIYIEQPESNRAAIDDIEKSVERARRKLLADRTRG